MSVVEKVIEIFQCIILMSAVEKDCVYSSVYEREGDDKKELK